MLHAICEGRRGLRKLRGMRSRIEYKGRYAIIHGSQPPQFLQEDLKLQGSARHQLLSLGSRYMDILSADASAAIYCAQPQVL